MRKLEIELFKEIRSCKDCLYSWDSHTTGFCRGHSVLFKGKSCIFIPDDIYYGFPENIKIDLDQFFIDIGFSSISLCPKCSSENLFPEILALETKIEIEAFGIEVSDFDIDGENIRLKSITAETLRNFT
jgi:hypothetical protein